MSANVLIITNSTNNQFKLVKLVLIGKLVGYNKVIMKWLNWVVLFLGLWILVSPWLLNFSAYGNIVLWNNVISGVLVILFALWQLFGGDS